MTTQLALDRDTHDLILGENGGVIRVDEGRYTVQAVKSRLLTYLGEWSLDPTIGWLNFNDYEKNFNLFDIELRARVIIISTEGVNVIEQMSLEVVDRKLNLTFSATTIYGTITDTIGWI